MTLLEILAERKKASAEAYLKAQEEVQRNDPALPAPIAYKFVVCQEMEAYQALFDGCTDF